MPYTQTNLPRQNDDCISNEPAETVTDRLNQAFAKGGQGYTLKLCPGQTYYTNATISFAAPYQELSTSGYPVDDQRATIVVNGSSDHTIAIQGNCNTCSGISIKNLKVNGNQQDSSSTSGGSAIEIGGNNSNQTVEYVTSLRPRSSSCLHVSEGSKLQCSNVTIQNSDFGPCGSSEAGQWADGISMSCRDSSVASNMVNGSTDSAIAIVGAPGTVVRNNTIIVANYILRAGITMVDYLPWTGDYKGVVVSDNKILGGFSDETDEQKSTGKNSNRAIAKIGIAIGPRTWQGSRFGSTTSVSSGVVKDNQLSGAFSYGIALTSAENFTVQANEMTGNYTFIGNTNCTDQVPSPASFVVDRKSISFLTTNEGSYTEFDLGDEVDVVDCISPPDGNEDLWPFSSPATSQFGTPGTNRTPISSQPRTTAQKIGMGVGIPLAVVIFILIVWAIRRWAVGKQLRQRLSIATSRLSRMFQ